MGKPRKTAEDMYDGLLKRARKYVAEHQGTFWDMFSESGRTEPRKFYLSLPKEQRKFLRHAAAAEASLSG